MTAPQRPLPSARSTDAVERQRAEAKSSETSEAPEGVGEYSFKYDDVEYFVKAVSDWPIDVLEGMQDDKLLIAIRALLGPEQWKTFKSKPRTNKDFYAFTEELFKGDASRAES